MQATTLFPRSAVQATVPAPGIVQSDIVQSGIMRRANLYLGDSK
jgi:hypothetical protein